MDYSSGYFSAMDDVMHFINTLEESDTKKFRSLIYGFCLEARPKIELSDEEI